MTSRSHLLLSILGVFAPLSLLTIGGGQSVISEMQRQAVDVHGWTDESGFLALFAISRLLPGPGSLLAALVGWAAGGWMGAIAAAIGIFVPSSLLVYGLAQLWRRHRGTRWTRAVERGLAPIAAGLILSASLTLVRAAPGGWLAWAVAALSTWAMYATRLSPIYVLGGGAAAFLLLLR